jgi:hypothetical protein
MKKLIIALRTVAAGSLLAANSKANLGESRQAAINAWGPPAWQNGNNVSLYFSRGLYIEETYDAADLCQSVVFSQATPMDQKLNATMDKYNLPSGKLTWTELNNSNPNMRGWSLNGGAYYVMSMQGYFGNSWQYMRSYATAQGVLMTVNQAPK